MIRLGYEVSLVQCACSIPLGLIMSMKLSWVSLNSQGRSLLICAGNQISVFYFQAFVVLISVAFVEGNLVQRRSLADECTDAVKAICKVSHFPQQSHFLTTYLLSLSL